MNTQHTPGPWIAADDEVTDCDGNTIADVVKENQWNTTVGMVNVGMPWEANAKLIAAAPELLDALHKVLMALETVHNLYQMNTRKRIEQADEWAENAWNLIHKLNDE
jgi:hypothetical protein